MPTASDKAAAERDGWARLSTRWGDTAEATELATVVYFDPTDDLASRAARWGYDLPNVSLSDLASFAAGLAEAESAAWFEGTPDIATRAYEERRFLVSDRIIHWAVPWLVGNDGSKDAEFLLVLGDEMRVAPQLADNEGMKPAGEDSYGPMSPDNDDRWRTSLWSGALIPTTEENPVDAYLTAAERWSRLAQAHPGSAALWLDLARRATTTANQLRT
jgi:hypothetical protein